LPASPHDQGGMRAQRCCVAIERRSRSKLTPQIPSCSDVLDQIATWVGLRTVVSARHNEIGGGKDFGAARQHEQRTHTR